VLVVGDWVSTAGSTLPTEPQVCCKNIATTAISILVKWRDSPWDEPFQPTGLAASTPANVTQTVGGSPACALPWLLYPEGCGMSSNTGNETGKSDGLVPAGHRPPAVRREGAIAIGATAVGALALGALAIGALAIGKMTIGQLALGRAKVRRGQVDDLIIARLTLRELTVERVR
jgi:hypothetical protein